MKKKLLSLFCLIAFAQLHAQSQGRIAGTVVNNDQQPIAGATISLRSFGDSTNNRSFAADNAGKFDFNPITPGNYTFSITAAGYLPLKDTLLIGSGLRDMGVLVLLQQQTNMENVTVTSRRPYVEQKIDRVVVNVDALMSNAGKSAFEVLQNSPGVQVDENGAVTLKGKGGAVVFIDDKPTYMSGSDLVAYLRSLPAGALDKIELMSNPPARYDAAGNAGVINIRTKKIKRSGFNGTVNLGYSQGIYPKSSNSLLFNYRTGNVNFFGNVSYENSQYYNDLTIDRFYFNDDGSPASSFTQQTDLHTHGKSVNWKAGFDYNISKRSVLGVVATNLNRQNLRGVYSTNKLFNAASQLDSFITADNKAPMRMNNTSSNINYRYQFKKPGRELSMDVDYIRFNTRSRQYSLNSSYEADGTEKGNDFLRGYLPSSIDIYSYKADYVHPLTASLRMDAGFKTSHTRTDNKADYYRTIGGNTSADYDISNHFLYTENIHAAYLNFSQEWSKFSIQGGLRYENTSLKGNQLGNPAKPDSQFRRSYAQLFPTFYASYRFDSVSRNQLTLSYGKRINRPYYRDLNPFVSPLDKFTLYVGNPFLNPTISHTVELTHVFKNMITTSFSWNSTIDEIGETIQLEENRFYSRPGNISKSGYLSLSVNASLNPVKAWTLNMYAELTRVNTKSALYTEQVDTAAYFGYGNISNQVQLGKGWTAELGGFYLGQRITGQFVLAGFWVMNAGIQKKILNNKGTVKLTGSDIFHTRINQGKINNLRNGQGRYRNILDSQIITLNFVYSFGKSGNNQRRKTGGADDERQRAGN